MNSPFRFFRLFLVAPILILPLIIPKQTFSSTTYTPGTGNGLSATYFNSDNLTNLVLTRTDPNVAFNWGQGTPDNQVPPDFFSVRWAGRILAPTTDTYTFYTTTDDGVRLWINNTLLIDKWQPQSATLYSDTINLQANTKYDIKMEYFEDRIDAVAELSWSNSSFPQEIIPQSQLFSSQPTSTAPAPAKSTTLNQSITFYGWNDNDPPGAGIAYPSSSYPTVHNGAGGSGTYNDPISLASDPNEWPIGTKMYLPYLKKYAVMEDLCTACQDDWQTKKLHHIDVWMNSNGSFVDALYSCEDFWTRDSESAEINPPSDREVDTTPLFDPLSGKCSTPL